VTWSYSLMAKVSGMRLTKWLLLGNDEVA
jgi:hypothetical protein